MGDLSFLYFTFLNLISSLFVSFPPLLFSCSPFSVSIPPFRFILYLAIYYHSPNFSPLDRSEIAVVVLAHDLVPDHVIVVHLVIAIVAAEETLAQRAGAEALLSPETTRGRSPGLLLLILWSYRLSDNDYIIFSR